MLILGIETATEQVSVAIGGHEGVLGMFEVCRGRRHAETLTPAIEFVCRQAEIELAEISVIAVDVGQGLFTGMRVGLAAGPGDLIEFRPVGPGQKHDKHQGEAPDQHPARPGRPMAFQ